MHSPHSQQLYLDLKVLIDEARMANSRAVNAELTRLYWHVGKRIQEEILGYERADYGKNIIQGVSVQLANTYGKGWSEKQLHHCVRFVNIFPNKEIVYTLCRQLNWSQIRLYDVY